VLPFTSTDANRQIQQCVSVEAKEGKLVLVATDGFSLADVSLPYDEGEGNALIDRDTLRGVANALKRANRVKVGFEPSIRQAQDKSGDKLDGMSLLVETELIRYKWQSAEGTFPEWRKLIPAEFAVSAQFDTQEAVRAVNALKALINAKGYGIDLVIGNGKVVLSDADGKGTAELPADTTGEGKARIDGKYLIQSLKACGGMVEFGLNNGYSPMQFRSNGYRVIVMPMVTDEARAQAEKDRKATVPPPTTEKPTEKVTAVAEAEAIAKAHNKPKPNKPAHKAKQPVAV
jgi:DNA polymerase III sliding clamp (beta) subunit (PCNA family)